MSDMDPLFQAMSLFRRRQFEKCVDITTSLLDKNPNDQVRLLLILSNRLAKTLFVVGSLVIENACIDRTTLC
jgi:hypothetical protein